MFRCIRFASICAAAVVFLCFVLPVSAQVMTASHDVKHDVSAPFVEMTASLPTGPVRPNSPGPLIGTAAPTLGLSFDGLGVGFPGFTVNSLTANPSGAAGLTQYVQWVNGSFAVFNKSTGAVVLGSVAGKTIWKGFGGGCETNNDGDPYVTYDKIANRWVFSRVSVTGGPPFLECIAVSTASDATGRYNRYAFTHDVLNDSPKLAVWPDGYYETFNRFITAENRLVGSEVCALDRTAMQSGLAATMVCFFVDFTGILASDFDGTVLPPPGSPNYVLSLFDSNHSLHLFQFHVDFITPANSSFGGPTVIFVDPFGGPGPGAFVAQPGTIYFLSSFADRLMYRLSYRNFGDHESLVLNHSVLLTPSGSIGGVRWYEIQNPGGFGLNPPVVVQQSTVAPDTDSRWLGSIAMDKAGDIALGYNVSSSVTFPSLAMTGRLASDPASTMQPETLIMAGTGSQSIPLQNSGDFGTYSSMQVDPSDDCTFWFTGEYLKTTGTLNWSTRIASAKFSNCTGAPPPPPAALRFVPVVPCRIADTRLANGAFGGPFLNAGTSAGLRIPESACNIPATAQAYSLNVTVVPHGTLGFLTTFPCGQPQPLVSTLNSTDGRIKAVAAIVPAGASGDVCFFVTHDTELVLDINGYFVPAATSGSLSFFPVPPCRIVDTRNATGTFGGPSLQGNAPGRSFPILSGPCNLPATAQAYSLNYTAVPKTGTLGFLTTWPTGQTQPLVSTLNAPTGVTTANAAIVPAGTAGAVSVFVTHDTDLVMDVNGYFAPPGAGGLSLFNLPPCRVLDTRNNSGSPLNGPRDVNVTGSGCGAPVTAQSYVFNSTVVPSPGGLGFLTLWPQGGTQPLVSTLNSPDAAITSNMALVPTTNGSVSAFTSNPSHLILDISGYFAP